MLRRTLAIVAVAIGLVGFARAAGGETETAPAENTITLTAVKTERGPAIRVSTGGAVFVVPRLAFQSDDGTLGEEITVEDGKVWMTGNGVGRSSGLTGRLGCASLSINLCKVSANRAVPSHKQP